MRNGCTQHVTDTHVTHGALCYASLVVCHCGSASVCQVQLCLSVLSLAHTCFLADGDH